jgi:hypothetical protein
MVTSCMSHTQVHVCIVYIVYILCLYTLQNGATVSQFLTHSNIGIPPRPNAVVLGTELNDITLGSGLTGVDSTITVG